MKKYYSMEQSGRVLDINIYGDITSWPWYEMDISSYTLAKALDATDADEINVYINSYGGEVKEGIAIYNALRRHKAMVRTYCDGMACSIASVIFMAGEKRIMYPTSLLMIHNAWTYAMGNADELRKEADDLEIITGASINAYLESVNITEEALKEMLDAETWITPEQALKDGFATEVASNDKVDSASMCARNAVYNTLANPAVELMQTFEIDIADDASAELERKLTVFSNAVHEFANQVEQTFRESLNIQLSVDNNADKPPGEPIECQPREQRAEPEKQRAFFNFQEQKNENKGETKP